MKQAQKKQYESVYGDYSSSGIGGGDCCNNRTGFRKGNSGNGFFSSVGRNGKSSEEQFVTEMKNRIPVNEKGTYCITFDNSLYKKAFKLIKIFENGGNEKIQNVSICPGKKILIKLKEE